MFSIRALQHIHLDQFSIISQVQLLPCKYYRSLQVIYYLFVAFSSQPNLAEVIQRMLMGKGLNWPWTRSRSEHCLVHVPFVPMPFAKIKVFRLKSSSQTLPCIRNFFWLNILVKYLNTEISITNFLAQLTNTCTSCHLSLLLFRDKNKNSLIKTKWHVF